MAGKTDPRYSHAKRGELRACFRIAGARSAEKSGALWREKNGCVLHTKYASLLRYMAGKTNPRYSHAGAGRIAGLFSDCGSAKRGEVRGFMEKKRSGEALGLNDGRYRNLEWSKDERQNSD